MGRIIRLDDLLKTVDPSIEGKVKKTVEHWRKRTHTFLSGRSRLKLQRGEIRMRIKVEVKPAYPVSLGKLLQLEIDEQAEVLSSVRQQIECCKEDLEVLQPKVKSLSPATFEGPACRDDVLKGMSVVHDYLEGALRHVVIRSVVQKMLEVDQDILGVYRYQGLKGDVVLYWAVIGFIANGLGIRAEDLATVVLVHELAHGYTHIGIDADGHRWNEFSKVETGLAEALAQYYTHLALAFWRDSSPGPWAAYQRLTRRQTQTYQHHLGWVDKWPLEVVRSAMLEARKQKKSSLGDFERGLERESKRLEDF